MSALRELLKDVLAFLRMCQQLRDNPTPTDAETIRWGASSLDDRVLKQIESLDREDEKN